MPAGLSNNALLLGLTEIADRTLQVRLHYGDPGNAGTDNGIDESNAYAHVVVARNGFTQETGVTRFSNTNDVTFADADGGNWGDGSSDQEVGWLSLWYDADDKTNTVPGDFDTLLGNFELRTTQLVQDGDPFVLRRRTIDLVGTTNTE